MAEKYLSELGQIVDIPVLYEDNQSCIQYLKNNSSSNRVKHIDIKYCYINDVLNRREFALTYCPTSENLADVFTKPLSSGKLNSILQKLGVGCRGRVG